MANSKKRPSPSTKGGISQKPCERDREQSEVSFRLLFMNNPQPMWVYDLKTLQFLEVNTAAVSHYGYSRDEFLRMRITNIRPQEDVPRLLEDVSKGRGGLQHSGHWQHLLKDGRSIDVEITSHPLPFAGRQASLVVINDITERKKAEAALRLAEHKYRSIFEEARIGICQSTPDGRFLSVNPAMSQMFGYASPEEMIAEVTDIQQQLYVTPSRREELKRLMEEREVVQHFECELYRKDGSKMWISANVHVVHEGDAVPRYDGTFEDISERKSLEDQLRQAQKMEAVGRLAGGVAHDFNNALGVITGYSDLLQMQLPAGDPKRKYTEEISKAGHRAATLTRQLLAFSRKQVIQPVVLDLNSVIAETEAMLRRLIGEDIKIGFSRDLHPARVKADPGQVEQILMNLVVNARDAMPQGGKVFIETANVELDETYAGQHAYMTPGRYVMLSVSDTGCGMDKETQVHIFEPFFTTKEAGKGTGLGLSTVYGIVKQNGGYIWVYSEPDKGTIFKIYFPQAVGAAQPAGQAETSALLPSGSETILVVEDEEPLRRLARTCLESNGYSVLDVPDGDAAVEAVAGHEGPIHLVLTDVILPGMSGRDLAKHLTTCRPEMKVLYMSGYTNDLIAQYGVLDPDTMLLEKPFTLRSLLTKVHQALQSQAKAVGAS